MSAEPSLIVETPNQGVRRLTFNRPASMNAFDMDLFARLDAELAAAHSDDDIRAIILAASGDRAFSAGFDINEMADFDAAQMREAFVQRDPVMRHIAEHRCPVIAAVDGVCYGAGALVALACDMRLIGPSFRFRVTAATYGGANATWSLPALVGPERAKEILMTSRVVTAEEAIAIGLASRKVDAVALSGAALELASAIAANPPQGVAGIKALVDASLSRSPAAGWQAEHGWMLASMETAPGGADVFDKFLTKKNG